MPTAPPESLCACGHAGAFHRGGQGACTHPCQCRRFRKAVRPVPREAGRRRWRTVDWRKGDRLIAEELDVTATAVIYQRKKMLDKIRNKE